VPSASLPRSRRASRCCSQDSPGYCFLVLRHHRVHRCKSYRRISVFASLPYPITRPTNYISAILAIMEVTALEMSCSPTSTTQIKTGDKNPSPGPNGFLTPKMTAASPQEEATCALSKSSSSSSTSSSRRFDITSSRETTPPYQTTLPSVSESLPISSPGPTEEITIPRDHPHKKATTAQKQGIDSPPLLLLLLLSHTISPFPIGFLLR